MTNPDPARRLWICVFSDAPPITSAALGVVLLRSFSYCSWTCIASSRVGSKTRARICRDDSRSSISMIGIRNASVLPVPV